LRNLNIHPWRKHIRAIWPGTSKQLERRKIMCQVAIKTVDGKRAATTSVLDEVTALSEQIRERAFEAFARRGFSDGSAMDDWLNAERELFQVPESELVERNEKFEARVNAPGFEPSDVQVIAMPDALIVKAQSSHRHDETEGDVRFLRVRPESKFPPPGFAGAN